VKGGIIFMMIDEGSRIFMTAAPAAIMIVRGKGAFSS
jgi:hypothetical protein